MAYLLRVRLEFLFKLLFRLDKGHRVTGIPASSKEPVKGWRRLVPEVKQLESWKHLGDRLSVEICECIGNDACDSIRHKQSLNGG